LAYQWLCGRFVLERLPRNTGIGELATGGQKLAGGQSVADGRHQLHKRYQGGRGFGGS
jgi:hypothetical protein